MVKSLLSDEARAARAAYVREYRRKHPEKVARWEAARWERKAKQLREAAEHEEKGNSNNA